MSKPDSKSIEGFIQKVEMGSLIAMARSKIDGDPKHHKEFIAETAAQLNRLLEEARVDKSCIVRFSYFENGQMCSQNTLYLEPKKTIHIGLARMPGHFMDVELLKETRLAELKKEKI